MREEPLTSEGNSASAVPVDALDHFGRSTLRILLVGIDGSGKTTAADDLARAIASHGGSAVVARNAAGRRIMSNWWRTLRWAPGPSLQDFLETTMRVGNILLSELRLRGFDGVVILDRGLECQLALREARGLPQGVMLPWLLRVLPAPDVVAYFEVPIPAAVARIAARGTDTENAADLTALDSGYRRLPCFDAFTLIDAGGLQDDVLGQLLRLLGSSRRVTAS